MRSRRQLFKEENEGLDAAIEVGEVELFVGSVEVVVRKAKAHHDGRNLQVPLEVTNNGDRSTGADEDSVLVPDLFEGARGGLDVRVVGANDDGLAGMDEADVEFDAIWLQRFDIALVLGEGLLRILVGYEAHGDFGDSFGGDDGFCACTGEAAGHTMHIERRTRPGTLEDGVAGLAGEAGRADFGEAVVLFVKG